MDKAIPVRRETMNKPGRKVKKLVDKPGPLIYYCLGCNSKFKKMPAYGACPTCEGSVMAKNKEEPK